MIPGDKDRLPTVWQHPDGRLFMLALFGIVCLCTALFTPEARSLLATIGIVLVAVAVTGMFFRGR